MGKSNQSTQAKRNRERSRQERAQEKQVKRTIRSEEKQNRDRLIGDGFDPDLAGIIPGPQPPSEI